MPVIRIEIPQELLLNSQKEVVIRLNPAQLVPEKEVQASTEPAFLCFMDKVIVYQRRKTGQRLQVKCEKELIEITSKYANDSPFLLPIITDQTEPSYQQYRRCQRRVNRHLKDIGIALGLQHPLTTYVARHSWATIARNLDIPISVISKSMGHISEKTTRIYLDSISSNVIDRANQSIIEAITLPNSPKK